MISAVLAVLENEEQRNELAEFYQKNKKRLYAIAFSKLHNREAAEDAIQETFLRIADKPENFFQICHNKRTAYADVIIRNVSIDVFNKTNKLRTTELVETISSDDFYIPLENKIIGSFSKDVLINFILSLPPLQRDILELKVRYNLTDSEIASKLNITEDVVRQRLFHARKAIKNFMRSEDKSYE